MPSKVHGCRQDVGDVFWDRTVNLSRSPRLIFADVGSICNLEIRRDAVDATGEHVASAPIPKDRQAARVAIVEQHIRLENEHDLEGVLRTFGDTARYDDEPWGAHYEGQNGVRKFYEQLMNALPDLEIEVQRRHVTEDTIVVEVIIRGTHLGVAWSSGDRATS